MSSRVRIQVEIDGTEYEITQQTEFEAFGSDSRREALWMLASCTHKISAAIASEAPPPGVHG